MEATATEADPLVAAWRQSRVGSKLEEQWSRLSEDLPWTWTEIRKLRPGAIGFALLEVGQLEAVMVIDTPLAALPLSLPAGSVKSHGGVSYALVAPGAADGSEDTERRLGLAWARLGERLLLATAPVDPRQEWLVEEYGAWLAASARARAVRLAPLPERSRKTSAAAEEELQAAEHEARRLTVYA